MPACSYLAWLQATGSAATQGPGAWAGLGVLLVLAGPVTAVPLLLFAAGTARVPLSVVGLSQYIAPILQFLLAWAVFFSHRAPKLSRKANAEEDGCERILEELWTSN